MSKKLIFTKTLTVYAPVRKVWQALTDPAMIKQYLFGTNTATDWQKGSPIDYTGEYQGNAYRDKGTVVDIVPERLLHTTYFSSMSGKEDKPENYANVVYELEPQGNHTSLTISQDNIDNEEQLRHLEQNWTMVANGIKKVVEE